MLIPTFFIYYTISSDILHVTHFYKRPLKFIKPATGNFYAYFGIHKTSHRKLLCVLWCTQKGPCPDTIVRQEPFPLLKIYYIYVRRPLCQTLPLFTAFIIRIEHAVLCLLTSCRCTLYVALAINNCIRLSLTASFDHYVV